ncbi:MAG: Rap1a/Tai family immunity protein [Pseudomonadota bacterium]
MRRLAVAALVAMLASPPAATAEPLTAGRLAQACAGGPTTAGRQICSGFITGFVAGQRATSVVLVERYGNIEDPAQRASVAKVVLAYCLESEPEMEAVVDTVARALVEREQDHGMLAEGAVWQRLIDAYPCTSSEE